jgi:hypothetical protein
MARPVEHSLITIAKREDEELACTAGLKVKKNASDLRRHAESDYEDPLVPPSRKSVRIGEHERHEVRHGWL